MVVMLWIRLCLVNCFSSTLNTKFLECPTVVGYVENMSFYLSKLLGMFFSPLSLLFMVACFYVYKAKSGWKKYVAIGVLVCGWSCGYGPWVRALFRIWETPYPMKSIQEIPKADVAVVLSGMVDTRCQECFQNNRIEFGSSVDRILSAVDMLKQGKVKHLLLSGGSGSLIDHGERAESSLLYDWVHASYGVDLDRMWVDASSRNTLENAQESARILRVHHAKKVVLITSAWHLTRAVAAFRKVGISPAVYGVDYVGHIEQEDYWDIIPRAENMVLFSMLWKEWWGTFLIRQGFI
jgi:uncharacterized SAM-binding protein YcdF (DUF218 family)